MSVTIDAPPTSSLPAYLRSRRAAIAPGARSLGTVARLPSRVGRAVTQEEVAEAIGVSRVWYANLESGSAARTSLDVLDRIAGVFALDYDGRLLLLQLAYPNFLKTA